MAPNHGIGQVGARSRDGVDGSRIATVVSAKSLFGDRREETFEYLSNVARLGDEGENVELLRHGCRPTGARHWLQSGCDCASRRARCAAARAGYTDGMNSDAIERLETRMAFLERAVAGSPALQAGVNTYGGQVTHKGVAESQGRPCGSCPWLPPG